MGQLITTVVGGIAGFMIGGPFGAQVGMMLGGMIGATLFGPTIHGPRLNELKVTASTYGVAIPEIYGTVRLGGNLIWSSGIKETKKTQRAGKGGPKQTTYSYDCTFAMAICKGPIDEVLRIWADSKLIYDSTNGATREPLPAGNSLFVFALQSVVNKKNKKKQNVRMRVYRGDETQLPDSLIEADKGAGNVSAHRGMAYVVFEKLALEDFGNRVPQMTFEVSKSPSNTFGMLIAKDDELETANTTGTTWLADFDTGRLLNFGPEGTRTYALDSMTEVQAAPDLGLTFSNRSVSFIQGSNSLLCAAPPGSTAGFAYYNTATLALVSEHCVQGGLSNSYDPETDTVSLSPTGRLGYGRYAGGMHVVHTDWLGNIFLMAQDGSLLADIQAPFAPHLFVEGLRSGTGSQIIGWRAANNRLELFTVATPGAASHTVLTEGGTTVWVPDTSYTTSSVNLQPYPAESFTPLVLLYDQTDDNLFCLGTSDGVVTVFKYSLTTSTYKFLTKHPTLAPPSDSIERMRTSRITGGQFGWIGKSAGEHPSFIQIDLQSGGIEQKTELAQDFGYTLVTTGQQVWDDETGSVLISRLEGSVVEFYRLFASVGVTKVSVRSIVQDVCLRSGVLTLSDIDVSELNDDPITGYSIDRQSTARDALKQMATGYLFDAYESDYQLKFRSRGGDTVLTVDQSWLARNNDGDVVTETLTQELEMPLKISVNYYDITRDHQQGVQSAKRKANPFPTMWTAKEDTIDLPVVWTPDEAKQCADKLLKMAWANRTGYQMTMPWRYLKYDATDVVEVVMDTGTTYQMRMSEANIGADFTIEVKGVSEEATAYVSNAVGNAGEAPQQNVTGNGTAFPIIVNTPLLRDEDYDTSGSSLCYVTAGTNELSFAGTVVYMDDGLEYRAVGLINAEAISGYCLNALPMTNAYEATDEVTVLRVRLSDPEMELESVTQEDMLNFGANAALVGGEIIQFRDAVLQANGEWWLSGLLRARRGTNYALRDHAVAEPFVLLDGSSLASFYRPPESYITTRNFKAAAGGDLITDIAPVPTDLVPRDLMPYTPEDVRIYDDGATLRIRMSRRSRVTAGLVGGTGLIHYKEGDLISARITYKVWPGLTLDDTTTLIEPAASGTIAIFNSAGTEVTTEFSFDEAVLGAETSFLLRLAEEGVVEGTPKWMHFERADDNTWNTLELY